MSHRPEERKRRVILPLPCGGKKTASGTVQEHSLPANHTGAQSACESGSLTGPGLTSLAKLAGHGAAAVLCLYLPRTEATEVHPHTPLRHMGSGH